MSVAHVTTPVLMGPADADNYRVKVGRYGDRFYTDPLPACPIANASEWSGPSVSVTKPPFANKYVPMKAIADMPSAEWARLAELDATSRYETIKTHDKLVSRINMTRGTIVHRMAEDRLLGRVPLFSEPGGEAAEQAERFRPALNAFFDAHQPVLVACEVVCLHRTLNGIGYGGTADAFVEIEGDIWAVDWKSRNSDHAAYSDEAAQGGAYIGAEYMIVSDGNGGAKRAHIPDVAGVLIVSLREDGYRAYPIDAQGAINHYHEMHRWWVAQQTLIERKAIGRPWAVKSSAAPSSPLVEQQAGDAAASPATPTPKETTCKTLNQLTHSSESSTSTTSPAPSTSPPPTSSSSTPPVVSSTTPSSPATPDWRFEAKRRYDQLNDTQKADYTARKTSIDTSNRDAVMALLDAVDPIATIQIEPLTYASVLGIEPPPRPDEGGPVSAADIAALEARFKALPIDGSLWTGRIVAEGNKAHTFRIKDKPTVRRYEIYRGILALAEHFYGEAK